MSHPMKPTIYLPLLMLLVLLVGCGPSAEEIAKEKRLAAAEGRVAKSQSNLDQVLGKAESQLDNHIKALKAAQGEVNNIQSEIRQLQLQRVQYDLTDPRVVQISERISDLTAQAKVKVAKLQAASAAIEKIKDRVANAENELSEAKKALSVEKRSGE